MVEGWGGVFFFVGPFFFLVRSFESMRYPEFVCVCIRIFILFWTDGKARQGKARQEMEAIVCIKDRDKDKTKQKLLPGKHKKERGSNLE